MNIDDIYDIGYIIIWAVSLDENCVVKEINISSVMDMAKVRQTEEHAFVDFKPSEIFIERAQEQIREMNWGKNKPNSVDACAHSYIYNSNPDMPVSSNDNFR